LLESTSHGCAADRPPETDPRRETFITGEKNLWDTMRRRTTDATAAAAAAAQVARVLQSAGVETLDVDVRIVGAA